MRVADGLDGLLAFLDFCDGLPDFVLERFHAFAPLLSVGVDDLRERLEFGDNLFPDVVHLRLYAGELFGGGLDLRPAFLRRCVRDEALGLLLDDSVERVEVAPFLEKFLQCAGVGHHDGVVVRDGHRAVGLDFSVFHFAFLRLACLWFIFFYCSKLVAPLHASAHHLLCVSRSIFPVL